MRKIPLVLTLIVFVQIFSFITFFSNTSNSQTEEQVTESIELDLYAEKYMFTPNKLTVPYGANVTLLLHAKDRIHGFYLEGYEVRQTMCNEHNFTVSFIANKAGTYIFKCYEPACGPYHPYMVGSLTVEPNNQLSFQFLVIGSAFIFITVFFFIQRRKLNGS